jgi:hypothetical protein
MTTEEAEAQVQEQEPEQEPEQEQVEGGQAPDPQYTTKAVRTEQYKKLYEKVKKELHVDRKQIKSAIVALKKFAETAKSKEKSKDLFAEEDDFIYVTITLATVPTRFSPRPVQIPLKHPIYGANYMTHACLVVKDPQRALKDIVKDLEVPCLAKVMGYQKLLKNFKQYKDRRQLVHEFDLFFCDSRIYRMLPKATGSFFYRKKKFPCPLPISHDKLALQATLDEAFKCTYLTLGNGPHYSFRAARVSMPPGASLSNVARAIYRVLPHVLGESIEPTQVQCISLKTHNSPDLPIFNHLSETEIAAYLQRPEAADPTPAQ